MSVQESRPVLEPKDLEIDGEVLRKWTKCDVLPFPASLCQALRRARPPYSEPVRLEHGLNEVLYVLNRTTHCDVCVLRHEPPPPGKHLRIALPLYGSEPLSSFAARYKLLLVVEAVAGERPESPVSGIVISEPDCCPEGPKNPHLARG